jgi:hypothetical protein
MYNIKKQINEQRGQINFWVVVLIIFQFLKSSTVIWKTTMTYGLFNRLRYLGSHASTRGQLSIPIIKLVFRKSDVVLERITRKYLMKEWPCMNKYIQHRIDLQYIVIAGMSSVRCISTELSYYMEKTFKYFNLEPRNYSYRGCNYYFFLLINSDQQNFRITSSL